VTFTTLAAMYFRSFFVQGSFSTRYRQNAGIAFCLMPLAKRLWSDQEDRRKFVQRHIGYYNGNPFMSPLVIGALANMEEILAMDGDITEHDIAQFKKVVGPATGAVGDRFFWSALRPVSVIAGIAGALFAGPWGALMMLVAFNIPVLALRWHWLVTGYRLGTGVVRAINNKRLERAVRIIEDAGAALLAFVTVSYVLLPTGEFGATSVGTMAVFAASFYLLGKRTPPVMVLFVSIAVALAAGAIIEMFTR
jgi:mannose/fructose/N-acetylgalactosamine-specific phosphotransferase system component IID